MSAQASLNCLLDAVAGMRQTVERIAADYVPGEPIPGSELDRYRQDRLAVFEAADDARQSLADLIAERDALRAALKEVEDCAEYWSEYFVPVGLPDRIRAALAVGESA